MLTLSLQNKHWDYESLSVSFSLCARFWSLHSHTADLESKNVWLLFGFTEYTSMVNNSDHSKKERISDRFFLIKRTLMTSGDSIFAEWKYHLILTDQIVRVRPSDHPILADWILGGVSLITLSLQSDSKSASICSLDLHSTNIGNESFWSFNPHRVNIKGIVSGRQGWESSVVLFFRRVNPFGCFIFYRANVEDGTFWSIHPHRMGSLVTWYPLSKQ
jgi:hypothetical protein